MTTTDIRDIAIEAAAIAMGRAVEPGASGLGMRQRRELAELAYRAIVPVLARELRAQGDQTAELATANGSVADYAHAEGLRAAAVLTLSSAA